MFSESKHLTKWTIASTSYMRKKFVSKPSPFDALTRPAISTKAIFAFIVLPDLKEQKVY